jgi:uroporphyrinogen III methyltransferase/synthase
MNGKVWLVGAGPGDVGLLTIRGREVLQNADVVVYDALVGQEILAMIPDSARLIFAGKRSGNHFLRQEETNRVLLEEALAGNRVVRLKGGDPFLFGRGGEELELLAEHGVPFEIVPGITSAIAVPAYNGIPVTHRDFCSSVHIVTGHRRSDHTYDIDFDALVRTRGTLVFLMGIAALPDICAGLLSAGMDPDMPAAVLERGTTADQRRISATVGTLEAACAAAGVLTPAIIVVGKVCSVADTFSWFEKRSLAGVKVLLTRPRELTSAMAELLRARGAEVLELPAIRTEPVADDAPLRSAMETLAERGFDWLVFTSPTGVKVFFQKLMEVGDIRSLGGVKIAAIGQGTEKALRSFGLRADFLPSVYDGETLGRELAKVCAARSRILIPRASLGNPELVKELTEAGHAVTDVPTYDTICAASRVLDEKALLESGEIDFAVFTSASTVRGFAESAKGADLKKVNAVCIGRQTESAARALGMRTWTAERATLDSLADRVQEAAAEWAAEQNDRQ